MKSQQGPKIFHQNITNYSDHGEEPWKFENGKII